VATPVRRIVNASPLILLAKVGQLDLLLAGVPEIIVPDIVLSEVGARGPADPVFQEIQRAIWLNIVPSPPIPPQVRIWNLDAGESSVLAVALSDPECEAILDDRDARRCAQALKIPFRGTLGLILLAKQIGSIPSARPVVEHLRRSGLFLTDELSDQALALVGE
jgi:predicted nucleic acid-binding protein